MKYLTMLMIFIGVLNTWTDPRVVPLAITRRVNAYYRETGDLEGYVDILHSGYDFKVIEKVFLKSS